ncbi:MAG: NifB/NifX family molybdenum-iron cluster-binding protein, partial [Peptostreptococcaceae bacterium]
SAPLFIVCDLENNEIKEINNQDLHHEHGKCQPLKALQGNVVDAVIVGGIGQGAIMKLNSMGVKVYKSQGSTIKEDLELLRSNVLVQFPANHSCNHDGCGHH